MNIRHGARQICAIVFVLFATALPAQGQTFTCGDPSPGKQKGVDLYSDQEVAPIGREQRKLIARFFRTLRGHWRGRYTRTDCVEDAQGAREKVDVFEANLEVTWTSNRILHLQFARGRAQLDIQRIYYAFTDGYLREERDLAGQEAEVLEAGDNLLKVYRRYGQRVGPRVLPLEVVTSLRRNGRRLLVTRRSYLDGKLILSQDWKLRRWTH